MDRPDTPPGPLAAANAIALVVTIVVFSFFANLLTLCTPLFTLLVYDRVLPSHSTETLVALFLLVGFLILLFGLIDYARGRISARIAARIQTSHGAQVLRAGLGRDGNRAATVEDVDALRQFFLSPASAALADLPWTPVFAALLFMFHPALGWTVTAGLAVLLIAGMAGAALPRRLRESAHAGFRGAEQSRRQADAMVAQGAAAGVLAAWQRETGAALIAAIRADDRAGAAAAFSRSFRLFLQAAVLAEGAWLVLRAEMTPGAMVAASILLARAAQPMEQCLARLPLIRRAWQGWRRLDDFARSRQPEWTSARRRPPPTRLEVENLTILPPGAARPTLRGVSFSLAAGQALGVIGPAGAGKSVLAGALVGLERPQVGRVRLGGHDTDLHHPDPRGRIGYLPQQLRFFRGSLAMNIAGFAATPDCDRIAAVLEQVGLAGDIGALPLDAETRIDDATAIFSGGNRQRLGLARALYGDPRFLVFDEPGAAMDQQGIAAFNRLIADLKAEGRIIVVVSQRPGAIAECDRLLTLDAGRVLRLGSRDEVVRAMIGSQGPETAPVARARSA